jgi:diguanylate cyclase (GGDEF)-like protein
VIDSRERRLSQDDLTTLRDLAQMVEHELASAQLAIADELTGLSNRRGFMLACEQLRKISDRTGAPFALLMVDLDNMKEINDSHGHAAGDTALRDAAMLMSSCFRVSDLLARIGGDEFCVAMLGNGHRAAGRAVNRLMSRVTDHNARSGRDFDLLMSAGWAVHDPETPTELTTLMAEADRAMYSNKRARRTPPAC